MSFLSPDTIKSLEGKFIKFQPGETRKLQLLAHERRETTYGGVSRQQDVLIVIDVDTEEEKEVNANKSFMRSLAKLNDQLTENAVILVTPTAGESFTNDAGQEITPNVYDISIDPSSAAL